MATIKVTESNFDTIIANNHLVLLDFWASWCGPCKSFAKTYEAVSDEFPNIIFGKINIDEEKSLQADFNIMSIPHLMIFKDQVLVYSEAGALPASALKDLIQQAVQIDISDAGKQ